eukprot:gene4348-5349_t
MGNDGSKYNYFKSKIEVAPWFQVKLVDWMAIGKVTIYNRMTSYCPGRMLLQNGCTDEFPRGTYDGPNEGGVVGYLIRPTIGADTAVPTIGADTAVPTIGADTAVPIITVQTIVADTAVRTIVVVTAVPKNMHLPNGRYLASPEAPLSKVRSPPHVKEIQQGGFKAKAVYSSLDIRRYNAAPYGVVRTSHHVEDLTLYHPSWGNDMNYGSFTSFYGQDPFYQVKLTQKSYIGWVTVTNRLGASRECASRLFSGTACTGPEFPSGTFDGPSEGAIVGMSNSWCSPGSICSGGVECGRITQSSSTHQYTVSCGGRYYTYVYLQLPGYRALNFAELETTSGRAECITHRDGRSNFYGDSYICHQCTHRLAYLNLAHNFSDYSANYSTDYFTYYCDAYDFANYSTDYFTYYCDAYDFAYRPTFYFTYYCDAYYFAYRLTFCSTYYLTYYTAHCFTYCPTYHLTYYIA